VQEKPVEVKPATPVPQPTPPAKETVAPSAAVETPSEPSKPVAPAVNREQLLAELTAISVNLAHTIDPNAKSALNRAIVSQAKGAARQAKIDVVDTCDWVMDLALTEASEDNKYHTVLTAEVKGPGPDGNRVVIWQKSQPIYTVDLSKGKVVPLNVYNLLQRKGGEYADAFFEQFPIAVHAARAKFGK
jgi:hypothetical protein